MRKRLMLALPLLLLLALPGRPREIVADRLLTSQASGEGAAAEAGPDDPRPNATAAPGATPSPSPIPIPSARELLKNGDFCGYTLTFERLVRRDPLRATGFEKEVQDLFLHDLTVDNHHYLVAHALRMQDEDAAEKLAEGDSQHANFFRALLLSGQIIGNVRSRSDLRAALELLAFEAERDPSNAVWNYFEIGARFEAGETSAMLADLMRAMMSRPEFNAFYNPLTRAIWDLSLKNPLTFVLGIAVRASLPAPDYASAAAAIREAIDREDPAFAESALAFGKRLMRLQRERSVGPEGVDWSVSEHATGRSIARRAWERLHPEEPFPEELEEKFPALMENHPFSSLATFDRLLAIYPQIGPEPDLKANCDLQAWRTLLDEVRAAESASRPRRQ